MRGGAGFLILLLALAPPAAAQTVGPPGPYVVDVHGTMAGLPAAGEFLPQVPSTTVIPARGFGFDGGAHVYPFGFHGVRIGIGISALRARGTVSPLSVPATGTSGTATSGSSSTAPTAPAPGIAATFSGWSPQLSLNFGNRDGWSYVSAGAGRTQMRTVATSSASTDERTIDRIQTINFGGGARWFMGPHFAVGFDARFYRLGVTTASVPGPSTEAVGGVAVPAPSSTVTVTTPKTSLTVISVGISVR